MTTRNDITGDVIATKTTSDAYRNNYDAIFRKPKVEVVEVEKPVDPVKAERDAQTRRWWAYCEAHQKDDRLPSFDEFRDTILPTLNEKQYAKFLGG